LVLIATDCVPHQVVLISPEGHTITREARDLFEIAYACSSSLKAKAKKEKEFGEEREQAHKERGKLHELMHALRPLEKQLGRISAKLAKLRPSEIAEIEDFIMEPQPARATEAALQQALAELEAAKTALGQLPETALEEMRTTDTPSDPLRAAVEAVAVLLDTKPDFASVQNRLMRVSSRAQDGALSSASKSEAEFGSKLGSKLGSSSALIRRMLSLDLDAVPKTAPSRLRRYLEQPAPPPELEPVAAALRQWAAAVLQHDLAREEARMRVEQHACTVAMQTACECLCDLCGLHAIEEDLRGVLQMAAKYPSLEVQKEAETAAAAADAAKRAADEAAAKAAAARAAATAAGKAAAKGKKVKAAADKAAEAAREEATAKKAAEAAEAAKKVAEAAKEVDEAAQKASAEEEELMTSDDL
jgi:hypothetical protein